MSFPPECEGVMVDNHLHILHHKHEIFGSREYVTIGVQHTDCTSVSPIVTPDPTLVPELDATALILIGAVALAWISWRTR